MPAEYETAPFKLLAVTGAVENVILWACTEDVCADGIDPHALKTSGASRRRSFPRSALVFARVRIWWPFRRFWMVPGDVQRSEVSGKIVCRPETQCYCLRAGTEPPGWKGMLVSPSEKWIAL